MKYIILLGIFLCVLHLVQYKLLSSSLKPKVNPQNLGEKSGFHFFRGIHETQKWRYAITR
jgi:uncharacterized protein YhhL (DUF1145 family)